MHFLFFLKFEGRDSPSCYGPFTLWQHRKTLKALKTIAPVQALSKTRPLPQVLAWGHARGRLEEKVSAGVHRQLSSKAILAAPSLRLDCKISPVVIFFFKIPKQVEEKLCGYTAMMSIF